MTTHSRAKGLSDKPQAVDLLDIDRYITGLAKFIGSCRTPLTLAVQGDWGSGKTNTMLLIEEKLRPTAKLSQVQSKEQQAAVKKARISLRNAPLYTISFNTWQYSQFNLDGLLAISMMRTIVSELARAADAEGKATKVLNSLEHFARLGVNTAANVVSHLAVGEGVGKIVQDSKESDPTDPLVAIEMLGSLKQELAEIVKRVVTNDGSSEPGRVVVFIDDLDRLEPVRAVELLEALKLFLDIEHCVFVLAIDFDVVAQGVRSKYGEQILDAKKARAFFDKIIQVPFLMPVSNYQTDKLLNEAYQSADIQLNDDQKKHFKALIESSVRNNPRSIKRLMNTFMLLREIVEVPSGQTERLFAALCLQLAYPALYADISTEVFAGVLQPLFVEGSQVKDLRSELEGVVGTSEDEVKQVNEILAQWGVKSGTEQYELQTLVDTTRGVFSQGADGFDEEGFLTVIAQSAITGVGSGDHGERVERGHGSKIYTPEARRAEWLPTYAPEKLAQILELPERFVDSLERIELAGDHKLRVGMQVGNTKLWTIQLGAKRVGEIRVNQKSFRVQFEPSKWMLWNDDDVKPAENDFVKSCTLKVITEEDLKTITGRWATLFIDYLDLEA